MDGLRINRDSDIVTLSHPRHGHPRRQVDRELAEAIRQRRRPSALGQLRGRESLRRPTWSGGQDVSEPLARGSVAEADLAVDTAP